MFAHRRYASHDATIDEFAAEERCSHSNIWKRIVENVRKVGEDVVGRARVLRSKLGSILPLLGEDAIVLRRTAPERIDEDFAILLAAPILSDWS